MTSPADKFTGQTAVVTGAGTGLGRAFANRLASGGASAVALIGRRRENLEATAREIEKHCEAVILSIDIRDAEAVEGAMQTVVDQTGRLDILINNAAGNFLVKAENLTPNGFNAVVGIVLHGTTYCSLAAGRHMLRQGSGKILSIVASYAWMGGPGTLHSATAKAGVMAMTKTLAVEWGSRNVQVNTLCPGFVDTEQSRDKLWPTAEGRQELLDRIPAGRFGTVQEVVDAGLYLCGPGTSYITGTDLVIDGGEWLNKGAFVVPEREPADA